MADTEQRLLQQLGEAGTIPDSGHMAEAVGVEHLALVGVLKSLEAAEMIATEVGSKLTNLLHQQQHVTCHMPHGHFAWQKKWYILNGRPGSLAHSVRLIFLVQDVNHSRYVLTDEAAGYLGVGSPEAQAFNSIPADGTTLAALKVRLLAHAMP